jgi:glycosyltransferase involved in cell wall biosynthesis
MKISVLIPALNADPFIAAALASVRDQSHLDWEIVVVEDGSHDDTAGIVAAFAARNPQPVRYENLVRNRGIGAARNRLLRLARGDAFAFLDADDTWEPSHLESAEAALRSGAELVVSGVRMVDLVKRQTVDEIPAPAEVLRDPVTTLFRRSAIVTSSAVVLARTLVERTGWFDENLRIGEDRDYWLRAALAGARFGAGPGLTCNYSRHISSSMARTYLVAEHTVGFYQKHHELGSVPRRLRRQLLANSLITLGRLLRQPDPIRSAHCFQRAWRCAPLNPRIPLHLLCTRWRAARPLASARSS